MDTALLSMSHWPRMTVRCISLVKLLFRQLFIYMMLYSWPDISKPGSHFRSHSFSSLVKISTTGIVAACSLVSMLCVANSHAIYQKDYFLILLKESCVTLIIEKKIIMQKPVSSWNIWQWPEVNSDNVILRQSVHITFVSLCHLCAL